MNRPRHFPPQRFALGSLRPVILFGAIILLCPLYWQIHFAAPLMLLTLVQFLLAGCAINSLLPAGNYRTSIHLKDWKPCDNGQYYLDLSARLHRKGHRPSVEFLPDDLDTSLQHGHCMRLVDRRGNIRLFSDTPAKGVVEIGAKPCAIRRAAEFRWSSHPLSVANDKPDASYQIDP